MTTLDAVLLDRDGTINVKALAGEYVTAPEQLELLPGAATAIRRINEARVPVAVVTNQRGIALGRMTEADLDAVHARLVGLLAAQGAHLNALFHCPHEAGTCRCRKPGTLMLERARRRFGLASLSRTVMIGDGACDVQAGRAAGARTVLLTTAAGAGPEADLRAPSLLAAVDLLLGGDALAAVPARAAR